MSFRIKRTFKDGRDKYHNYILKPPNFENLLLLRYIGDKEYHSFCIVDDIPQETPRETNIDIIAIERALRKKNWTIIKVFEDDKGTNKEATISVN